MSVDEFMKKSIKALNRPILRLKYSLTYGNIWLAALSIIKKQNAYAYTLPEKIESAFGYKPSKLMTYFVLYKLQSDGLIAPKILGRRKYYILTSEGKKTLIAGKKTLSVLSKKL